jgi:HAD superfamily hydrolase (TIGR01509 family)
MIEAIIFDMDGTLVDTEPFNTEIEKRLFRLNKVEISEEAHQKYLGIASDAMWLEITEQHQLQIPVSELIEQNHKESFKYLSEVERIPIMPGLVDLLEKLQFRKYPMAVASSSTPEIIELILSRTNLKKYFRVIVSAQEAGKSKPEPDVFLLAVKKLGIKPANCLVVEDSENGIKAAQAAGMTCIAYEGPGADPEKQKEADAVIQNFSQLELIINES